MKCPHCDFERNEAFKFCPKCGKTLDQAEQPIPECLTPRALEFIKNDSFFVFCILLTVAVGSSLLSGGFNVLILLITIFSWLLYADARKGVVEHSHIKVISGSVYALYIITNILAVFIAFIGVLYTAIMLGVPFLSGLTTEMLTEELGSELMLSNFYLALFSTVAIFMGGIFIVAALLMFILNVAGRKKIHRFIKLAYKGIENGQENFVGAKSVSTWLIVFAVFEIFSALTYMASAHIFGVVAEGCYAAALIVLSILINKHFCDK